MDFFPPRDAKGWLFVALAAVAVYYLVVFVRGAMRIAERPVDPAHDRPAPTPAVGVGFVTNFFDTLGIGSFAPTTSIFKLWKMVPDQWIPGTLNVGHTAATIAQALIFTQIVTVDPRTLILMIAAAVAGAWLGAGVVAGWPRRAVQLGMGGALLVAATLMVLSLLKAGPAGGEAIALSGTKLYIGVGVNFALGALMTLGIGLYAPCMILISMLGMNPTTAFPIMMGSCAFLMPVASARFIGKRSFSLRAAVGLAVGGVPAVLLAAFVVKSLPLTVVRWLVVVVVLYTAITMLNAARRERAEAGEAVPVGAD